MHAASPPKSPLRRLSAWMGRRLGPRTPVGRWVWLVRLHGPFPRLRTHRAVTRLLGPQYARSRRRLEIDLTYACNLACANCNRSVPQAPSSAALSAADIAARISEWERHGLMWERVRLLGGEPTLHPEFFLIVEELREWRRRSSPATRIEVTTNGFGAKVAAAIARIPADIVVNNSAKENDGADEEAFDSFNIAPRDVPAYAAADFENGCRILTDCGMGLAPGGYYHCAVAAGIDRVLGRKLGRPELPAQGDELRDQMRGLCGWCGHFKRELARPLAGQVSSASWEKAYEEWRLRRPGRVVAPARALPLDDRP